MSWTDRLLTNGISPTTQKGGRRLTQGSLNSAIAYVRGGIRPDAAGNEIDEGELAGYEWRLLKSYCSEQGLIVPASMMPLKPGGAEHDVLFDSGRWLKFTLPRRAGYTVYVDGDTAMMLPATPLQYLARWRIANRIFRDDAELIGVLETDVGSRIVISQRDIAGEDATWDEIEGLFVNQMGFKRVDPPRLDSCGGYHSRAYWRGRYAVFDVRPPNCVRTVSGVVEPIDVIPIVCSLAAATYLSGYVVH